jgi:hypothetical protein
MNDDGREGQRKSDRRPPSAGSMFDPAAKPEARLPVPPAEQVAPTPIPSRPEQAAGPPPDRVQSAWIAQPVAAPVVIDLGEQPYEAGSDLDEEELPLTLFDRIRRLQPVPVVLTICSVGAFIFLTQAMTSHTTPIPVLMSAGVVTSLVFAIDAGAASVGTLHASREARTRRALLLSILGGVSAIVSAGAFSGVLIMVLVLNR